MADTYHGDNCVCYRCMRYRADSTHKNYAQVHHILREERTVSSTGGEKGVKEARYDLIPVEALEKVAILYGRGAKKYEEHNWRKGYEWSKSYAAMQRHIQAFWRGEDFDDELDVPHLASAIFHALSLLTFMDEHPEFDDRFIPEEKDCP